MTTATITLDGITFSVTDPYTLEALRTLVATHPCAQHLPVNDLV